MIKQWTMAAIASLPLAVLAADPAAPAAAPTPAPAPVTAPAAAAAAAPAAAAPAPAAAKARKPHSKLRALQKDCNNMADQKKLADEQRKKYIADCMRTH